MTVAAAVAACRWRICDTAAPSTRTLHARPCDHCPAGLAIAGHCGADARAIGIGIVIGIGIGIGIGTLTIAADVGSDHALSGDHRNSGRACDPPGRIPGQVRGVARRRRHGAEHRCPCCFSIDPRHAAQVHRFHGSDVVLVQHAHPTSRPDWDVAVYGPICAFQAQAVRDIGGVLEPGAVAGSWHCDPTAGADQKQFVYRYDTWPRHGARRPARTRKAH